MADHSEPTSTSGEGAEPAELAEPGEGAGSTPRCFRLLLEFDGSGFEGWQLQRRGERTVQGCLLGAAQQIVGGSPAVAGSSRTDSGVHAEGLVARLRAVTGMAAGELQRALNGVLPSDLVVREVVEVGADFDPQRDACWKAYRYQIWNARERSPLRARRALHVPQELDLSAMRRAAGHLVGRHDFRCFQGRAADGGVEQTVRELYRVEVLQPAESEVAVLVEGSGFLRYMVRNIVGTLLEVARGRREAADMPALLASRDRTRAGPTAAAHGLTLERVGYQPYPSRPARRSPSPQHPATPTGPARAPSEQVVSAGKSGP